MNISKIYNLTPATPADKTNEMERQIKFRAWHSKNKSMDYEFSVHADGCVYQPARRRWDISDIAVEAAYDDLIIMQFTGLRDCNDKDIYEGDHIHFQYNDICEETGYGHCVGVVSWGACGFIVKEIGFDYTRQNPSTLIEWLVDEKCNICGNIFEN